MSTNDDGPVYSLSKTKAELVRSSPDTEFKCDWCGGSIANDRDDELWVGTKMGNAIIGHARCAGGGRPDAPGTN